MNVLKAIPKICIVGSGPAGFYAAQHLFKHVPGVQIDLYEKLPVPFGLVRFGVAPDHPEVKNVINTFSKTAQNANFTFLGNVALGVDVKLRELRDAYHVVLLTYGAEESRRLNIPGEDLKNVIPARRLVGWYNGVPDDKDLVVDVSRPKVAIFGQGNVAVDIARILLTPIDLLKNTDITEHSLQTLSESKIKEVLLIGRRGPLQAAFTIKELRELLKLQGCSTRWNKPDFQGIEDQIPNLPRPRKRITELMLKSLSDEAKSKENHKLFKPIFFRSPFEISGSTTVEKVKLTINKLDGIKAVPTGKSEEIACNLAITSVGYKSVPADSDIPFNSELGVAENVGGKISEGLYATGWLATGPTGVILSTMGNAFAIAEAIASELKSRGTQLETKPGKEGIIMKMKDKRVVFWDDWLKIDRYEVEEGKKRGKPREKIVDVDRMLDILK